LEPGLQRGALGARAPSPWIFLHYFIIQLRAAIVKGFPTYVPRTQTLLTLFLASITVIHVELEVYVYSGIHERSEFIPL